MHKMLFLLAFIFFSCKKNKSTEGEKLTNQHTENLNKNFVKKVNAKLLNEEELCKQVNIVLKVNKTENERIIKFEDIKLITPLEQDTASLFWKNSKSYTTNYPYGHLDYKFNENEKGFMLFRCNENYSLLFLEVHTEEFPTFQKIKLDNTNNKVSILGDFTMTYENSKKLYKEKEIQFFIANINGDDILISKNSEGKTLGIYNKEIIVEIIKGSIIHAQVETYLNVRSEPNSSGNIIAKAYPKDGLKVIEVLTNWIKVSLNGTEGYVSSEFVK